MKIPGMLILAAVEFYQEAGLEMDRVVIGGRHNNEITRRGISTHHTTLSPS